MHIIKKTGFEKIKHTMAHSISFQSLSFYKIIITHKVWGVFVNGCVLFSYWFSAS